MPLMRAVRMVESTCRPPTVGILAYVPGPGTSPIVPFASPRGARAMAASIMDMSIEEHQTPPPAEGGGPMLLDLSRIIDAGERCSELGAAAIEAVVPGICHVRH